MCQCSAGLGRHIASLRVLSFVSLSPLRVGDSMEDPLLEVRIRISVF